MKIVTIVGARPQFIKAAVMSRELRKAFDEKIIHTGQHYDENMSDIFFQELEIPKPDYNLNVAAQTHGEMTGRMLVEIEKILMVEQPDLVIVYGDTNSTIAGALAAVKLHIPICHIEAGVRVGSKSNPEEVNRILTDHIASCLMCCTETAIDLLKNEGIVENVFFVGDPMFDAFTFYTNKIKKMKTPDLESLDGARIEIPSKYYYLTCHREENTDDEKLFEILTAMNSLDHATIYPVHPRNKKRIARLMKNNDFDNILFSAPVGYLTSVYLTNHAEKIVTDSGGLQREAYFSKKQCVTILNFVAWPETMHGNWNCLSVPNSDKILKCLMLKPIGQPKTDAFGAGNVGETVARIISELY